ncbi:MAG: uracil-DNA glycosylase [Lentisphaerae bacterium]|nr:uracil-DNA glycosylase [Lentisphaerota bacterium]
MRTVETPADDVARLAEPPPRRAAPARSRPATPAALPASPRDAATEPAGGLEAVARRIASCTLCPLHRTRTRTVPGQGNPRAELLFVGEGPGADEDRQGLAFVGRAGQLLTRLIIRMGFAREDVFIANIVKCRPTEDFAMRKDRPPTEEEMRTCIPYLEEQIAALAPKAIVCLGATAVFGLLGLKGISRLRGQWQTYRGIPVMPTYHPSYLLRGGGDEKARYWDVWNDMLQVLARLGRPAPEGRKASDG